MKRLLACPIKNLGRENFIVKLVIQKRLIFNGACLLSILSLLFFASGPVLAHTSYSLPEVTEGQVNEALIRVVPLRFLPGEAFYPLITAKEIIQRFFQPASVNRAQFDLVLSGKRIKEAYLLLERKDVKNASFALDRYEERLIKLVEQLEKARSQNQDVVPFVDRIASDLEAHETIMSSIYKKWQGQEDAFDFDSNFGDAIFGFSKAVSAINNIKPGLKDRYSVQTEEKQTEVVPYITPPDFLYEASPSVRPKRIIY